MLRTAAAALVLLCGGFGAAWGAPPAKPTREELSNRVLEHLEAPTRPYVPTDLIEPSADAPTRFDDKYGRLKVILLDDKVHPSLRGGRTLWALTEALVYWPSNGHEPIVVPRGFVTDLASIPRPLWGWLPPDGPWAKAAVVHDFLYYTQGTGVWKCHESTLRRTYDRDEADWILRDAQKDRNVGIVSRNLIWLGVHLGGQHGWDDAPGPKESAKCETPPQSSPRPEPDPGLTPQP